MPTRKGLRCSAKSKSTGKRCRSFAVTGYRVCRVHGAGSPKKGRKGGRPPEHGLYSEHLARDLGGVIDELRQDPHLTDGLLDIAHIRALTARSQTLLRGEEERFLSLAEGEQASDGDKDGDLLMARARLLAWYERLAALATSTLASIERYYGALERKEGGVALAGLNAALLALVRVLHETVEDEALRELVIARIREEFRRIVVPNPGGGA